jgi:V/A-type H+-transporting ATPase subunit A
VECLGSGGRVGSITIVGAVSPPGGDFSEPITQNTLRIAGTFWALDTSLAYRRHFPSVNWIRSHSLYLEQVKDWFIRGGYEDWKEMRDRSMYLLQKEVELQEIVQLVGPDALPESEKAILEVTRMIREDFLQQSAYHDVDSFCSLDKQYWMLKVILAFYNRMTVSMAKGVPLPKLLKLPVKAEIGRMKELPESSQIKLLVDEIEKSITALEVAQ